MKRGRCHQLVVMVSLSLLFLGVSATTAVALPPSIESESATNVTADNATLRADINPNGLTTQYMLQIDTTGHFKFFQNDGCILHPPKIACPFHVVEGEPLPPGLVEPPEASLPAVFGARQVKANLADIGATLQPNTTYHYRAIASSGGQLVEGPDQTFTTLSMGFQPAAPTVESVWVSGVAEKAATLLAEIHPHGLDTHYRFHLSGPICPPARPGGVTCTAIGFIEIPLPVGEIPGYDEEARVELALSTAGIELNPGTEYRYGISATSEGGSVQSGEKIFTTRRESPADPRSGDEKTEVGVTPTDDSVGGVDWREPLRLDTSRLSPAPVVGRAATARKAHRCKRKSRLRRGGRSLHAKSRRACFHRTRTFG